MTPFIHILFALSYLVTASAVALTLPAVWPGVDAAGAMIAGIAVALAGGLVHEVVSRVARDRRLEDRLDRLIRTNEDLVEQLAQARDAMVTLKATGEGTGRGDAVLAELRLIRQHLAAGAGPGPAASPPKPAEPPPRPAAMPRSPPAAPSPLAVAVTSGGPVFPVPRTQTAASRPGPPDPPSSILIPDNAIVDAVREGLKQDRVDIYLQPIVSLPHRKHRFYEVFSRIRTADGQSMMPGLYLDQAKRANLIGAVDNQLLMRCVQLIRETERRQHQIGFFVNLSTATIADPAFMRPFLDFAAANPSLCSKLIFELGQVDLRAGGSGALMILEQIARLGIRFSLDRVEDPNLDVDLLAAHDFRFAKLEAARYADPAERLRFGDLKDRLRSQSIDVIIEKIETDPQLADLTKLGMDFGQGFLFGEPRLSRKMG